MNVLQNLVTLYNTLPVDSTYRVVVHGILSHLEEMPEATMYDVADITNTSRTTVWRTIQKMGYTTFSDFHTALKVALTQYQYYNHLLGSERISSEEEIPAAVSNRRYRQAQAINSPVGVKMTDELVELMHKVKRISFYFHVQFVSTTAMMTNLFVDGKDAVCFSLLPDIMDDVQTLDGDSLVIAMPLAYSETADLSPAFELAKENGATVYIASETNHYRKYADYSFLSYTEGKNVALPSADDLFMAASELYRFRYID